MQPSPPTEAAGGRNLRLRILSAVVLAPLVLGVLYLGSPYSDVLFVACAGLLAWEGTRLSGLEPRQVRYLLFIATVSGSVLAGVLGAWLLAGFIVVAGSLLLPFWAGPGLRLWLFSGAVYLTVTSLSLVWLRESAGGGWPLFLWLLLVVWATDSGAYVAGRLIGGPKLLPRISPNKTWAGLLGGMFAAAGAAAAAAGALGGAELAMAAVMGACLALIAQAGDLLESWVKRRFDAKDSSQLIPGHGGLFDRVDGLLAAGFALALLTARGIGPF